MFQNIMTRFVDASGLPQQVPFEGFNFCVNKVHFHDEEAVIG